MHQPELIAPGSPELRLDPLLLRAFVTTPSLEKSWERFPNAPIVEAILFIETLPPLDLHDEAVEAFHSRIRDQFPSHEQLEQTTADFALGKDGVRVQRIERDHHQHQFVAEHRCELVQLRRKGIAVNRFAPYPGWEPFRKRAEDAWDAALDTFSIEHIANLGIRYVNRIELPPGASVLSDYLRTAPSVPESITTSLNGFFLRLSIPREMIPAHAAMRVGIQPAANDSTERSLASVLTIDIDATVARPIDPDSVWQFADQLRDFKNQLFFESITDRTKALFR